MYKIIPVISELSTSFINLPADQVDRAIEAGLRRIVEALGGDRSSVFQLSSGATYSKITHSYARPGFPPVPPHISIANFRWLFQKLLQKESVVVATTDDLPEEAAWEKQTMIDVNVKSIVLLPLFDGERLMGNLHFTAMVAERTWPEPLIPQLQLVAEIFANALARQHSDQKLQEAFAEIKQLKDQFEQENLYLRNDIKLLHRHPQIIGRSQGSRRFWGSWSKSAALKNKNNLLKYLLGHNVFFLISLQC